MDQSAIKRSLIESIMVYTPPGSTTQFKTNLHGNLNAKSIEDLSALLAQCISEHKEQAAAQIEDIHAQRSAESALFDLQNGGPQKRQAARQAQIDKDMGTLAAAAKATRAVGCTQANLQILVEAIGPNFSLEQAKSFIETNGNTMMTAPSTHEIHSWNYQDAQDHKAVEKQRVEYLRNADSETLRSMVKEENIQARATAIAAQTQAQVDIREQRDAAVGYAF
jgi:hypothetical protein